MLGFREKWRPVKYHSPFFNAKSPGESEEKLAKAFWIVCKVRIRTQKSEERAAHGLGLIATFGRRQKWRRAKVRFQPFVKCKFSSLNFVKPLRRFLG